MNDERLVWILLVKIFGPGNPRIWELSANYDNADDFYNALCAHEISEATAKEYENVDKYTLKDAERILEICESKGMNVYCYESEGYPERLKYIANSPAVLCSYGSLDFLNHISTVAFVGTREPSKYSESIARFLSKDLIEHKVTLASGFANGIDQIANLVSLDMDVPSIAVCGTALDHDYPSGSLDLKKRIAEKGVVISEILPTTKPGANPFKYRNRILIGISRGVVFIEAGAVSHGLDNYIHATSQGKPVFVVPPSDITDKRYFGQRYLLRNNCIPVFNADDIVSMLSMDSYDIFAYTRELGEYSLPVEDSRFFVDDEILKRKEQINTKPKPVSETEDTQPVRKSIEPDYSNMNDTEIAVCKTLLEGKMLADNISLKTGLDISTVLSTLTLLELEGTVKSLPGNQFELSDT